MYTALYHQRKPVCLQMFQFLHTIGKKHLTNLMANMKENGLIPRVHRNVKRIPNNALSLPSTKYIVRFLCSNAEQHAFYLDEYLATPAWIFNCCCQVRARELSGGCTMKLQKESAPFIQSHTPHSAIFGGNWYPHSQHEAVILPVAVSTEQHHHHTFC